MENVSKQPEAPKSDPIAVTLELAARLDQRTFEEVMRYASPLQTEVKR